MSVSEAMKLPAPERLTWQEICERYPCEWVMLVEMDFVNLNDFDFRSAIVLGHSNVRGEALKNARAEDYGYQRFGYFWTGPIRFSVAE